MLSPVPISNDFSPKIKFGRPDDAAPAPPGPNFSFSPASMVPQHPMPHMFNGRVMSPHHQAPSPGGGGGHPGGMMSPQHGLLPHGPPFPPGALHRLPHPPPHLLPPGAMIPPHGFPPGLNLMMLHMMQQQQPPPPGLQRPPGTTPPPARQFPPHQALIFNPQNPNAPPIHPCGTCHRELQENEEAVMCESGCHFFFHRRCIAMSAEAYAFIRSEPYAEWLCDNCAKTKNVGPVKFRP